MTVGRVLKPAGYSLQGNAKTVEGTQHPDRDAQFRYINTQVSAFQATCDPGISVDAKKGSPGMSVGRLTQTRVTSVDRQRSRARSLRDESRCAAQPVGTPLQRQERFAWLRHGPAGRS